MVKLSCIGIALGKSNSGVCNINFKKSLVILLCFTMHPIQYYFHFVQNIIINLAETYFNSLIETPKDKAIASIWTNLMDKPVCTLLI